jgi:poly(hydroxyalkanoate) granule-associated protein
MNTKITFPEELENNVLVQAARKFYLAGLGAAVYAFSFAQDEFTELSDKFIKQGEKTEKKTRDMVSKQIESRQQEIRDQAKRVEDEIEDKLESMLHTLNIPTKKDIDTLTNKINRLNKKVGELSKAS